MEVQGGKKFAVFFFFSESKIENENWGIEPDYVGGMQSERRKQKNTERKLNKSLIFFFFFRLEQIKEKKEK